MKDRKEMQKEVIEHFGEIAQIHKTINEMDELKDELLNCDKLHGTASRQAVLEELADVYNMLEQLKLIFEFEDAEVEDIQNLKMERTIFKISRRFDDE